MGAAHTLTYVPWNKGELVGQKAPLKQRRSGRSESGFSCRRTLAGDRAGIEVFKLNTG